MNYTQHPLSAAFPSMISEDFQSLKDSIKVNGVLNPITLYEGQVIDGWHRYRAASELMMGCPEQQMDSGIDPKDFVRAQNKNRRHQLPAALALAEVAISAWYPANRPNNSALSADLSTTKVMAEKAGVSERSIEQAKTVHKNASQEVKQAVKDGKIGLPKAVALSKLSEAEQAAGIEKPLPRKITPIRPEYSEADRMSDRLKEAHHAIDEMADEITALKDGIATEGDLDAKELVESLRAEIKLLTIELNAIKTQRDILQEEKKELMSQCKYYERKLKAA
jgi:hypothetical protein